MFIQENVDLRDWFPLNFFILFIHLDMFIPSLNVDEERRLFFCYFFQNFTRFYRSAYTRTVSLIVSQIYYRYNFKIKKHFLVYI